MASQRQRRCRSKAMPRNERIYVKPTNNDVLRGRGGRTNFHEGNQRLLVIVRPLQRVYAKLRRGEKWQKSREIVSIVNGWGGRFLEKEIDSHSKELYYIMTEPAAIRLVEQKFRDEPNRRKNMMERRSKAANRTENVKDDKDDDDESFVDFVRSIESLHDSNKPFGPAEAGFRSYQSDHDDVIEFGLTTDTVNKTQDSTIPNICISPSLAFEDLEPFDVEFECEELTAEVLLEILPQATGDRSSELCEAFTTVDHGDEGLRLYWNEGFSAENFLEISRDPYSWGEPFSTCDVLDPGLCLTNDQLCEICHGDGDDFFALAS